MNPTKEITPKEELEFKRGYMSGIKDVKDSVFSVKQLESIDDCEKDFCKLFVHKGEDCDDPEEKWTWTIRGSFPIEVLSFIRSEKKKSEEIGFLKGCKKTGTYNQGYSVAKQEEKEKWETAVQYNVDLTTYNRIRSALQALEANKIKEKYGIKSKSKK